MTKYTATFADGTTITRKTDRVYAVAWRSTFKDSKGHTSWTKDGVCVTTGFAASADKVAPFKPAPYGLGRMMSANDRAIAKAKNAQFLIDSGYTVEIVPVVAE